MRRDLWCRILSSGWTTETRPFRCLYEHCINRDRVTGFRGGRVA